MPFRHPELESALADLEDKLLGMHERIQRLEHALLSKTHFCDHQQQQQPGHNIPGARVYPLCPSTTSISDGNKDQSSSKSQEDSSAQTSNVCQKHANPHLSPQGTPNVNNIKEAVVRENLEKLLLHKGKVISFPRFLMRTLFSSSSPINDSGVFASFLRPSLTHKTYQTR
jgi:hypothetical protein